MSKCPLHAFTISLSLPAPPLNPTLLTANGSSTPVDSPLRGHCRSLSRFPAGAKWCTCRSRPGCTWSAEGLAHLIESHQQPREKGQRLLDMSCSKYQRRSTLWHRCRRGLETYIAHYHHRTHSQSSESSCCNHLAPHRLGLGLRLGSAHSDRGRRRWWWWGCLIEGGWWWLPIQGLAQR